MAHFIDFSSSFNSALPKSTSIISPFTYANEGPRFNRVKAAQVQQGQGITPSGSRAISERGSTGSRRRMIQSSLVSFFPLKGETSQIGEEILASSPTLSDVARESLVEIS
ncbi:hypothetical protein SUGI_1043620 [Cryptomeria japonica]|nr:hypothetical protein SUGI_1043620 [Cryptomeria japonica]